jgi:hypothetical protein
MRTDVARDYWDDWGLALLWTSMLLGPLAVSLDLLVGYALVKPLCASGDPERLRLISFAALSLTVIGIVVGASCFARLRQTAVDDGGRVIDRSYFMAVVAIGFNVLCAIVITTAGGARFIMSCE